MGEESEEKHTAHPLSPAAPLQVFGNGAFRSQQRQIIEAALRGESCFVLMPTGGAWRHRLARFLALLLARVPALPQCAGLIPACRPVPAPLPFFLLQAASR